MDIVHRLHKLADQLTTIAGGYNPNAHCLREAIAEINELRRERDQLKKAVHALEEQAREWIRKYHLLGGK